MPPIPFKTSNSPWRATSRHTAPSWPPPWLAAPAPPPPVESTPIEPEPGPGPERPWPPRPRELARWPVGWRERWGELSNRLEGEDVPFPESERRAFRRVEAEMADRTRRRGPRYDAQQCIAEYRDP